ncbi:MAG: Gfo/Idh/MocA family oxidoreductase [Planctomycetes bacterium]|nr:Gfo/Idh/MocA family oxidoreductase [Planctomycetota bacterium]
MNRRCFLRTSTALTAGLIGFPYIVRASALGKAGTVAPSNRLTLAQIGCGGMGGSNLRSFLDLGSEIQVIAVCDVDDLHSKEKKKWVDEKYETKDCTIYRDFREMLDRESFDIVSQALPDHWHAAVTLACASRGIDMYGEKPFSRTLGEGRAMCEAISRYGLVWQTGSWQRSETQFRHAAELVRNGRIGKVGYVEVGLPEGSPSPQVKLLTKPDSIDWQLWLGPAPWRPYQDFGEGGPHYSWRHIMDYSGGKLTDWGGHHIDIAHWGLGLEYTGPVEIEGKGSYPMDGIYDVPYAYNFICTYDNGVQIRVADSSQLPHGMGTCWYGEKGWIHVTRGQLQASAPKILEQQIGPNEILLYKSQNHHQNFIDCVKSRKETVAPAEVAHRSISVAFLGEIAMLTGRTLHWNPQTEQFVNDDDANRYLTRPYRESWRL